MFESNKLQWFGLKLLNVLFLVVIIYMVLMQVLMPLNTDHDCACIIHCSQFLIDGKLPYVDFIYHGPPLIIYLYTII